MGDLFDPSRMKAKAAAAGQALGLSAERPMSVAELAARIDSTLRQGLPDAVWVVGEVSGFRDRTHWYLDIKDANAVVSVVMFQSAARKAGFIPENGQQVAVRGRVEWYAKGGKLSLLAEKMQPVGAGALELAYKALCEELRGLGYFAQERKRPLPTFPRRIAVITSRSGAALQDVLVTMQRRCPAVGVLLIDARMQGATSAPEVAEAISYVSLHAERLGVDAVLVTRGGGSMEDLWAFNERVVADAILACSIPIVAAIGHETDTTIAELVADERCATPTQAAMRLTPDSAALLRQVESVRSRISALVQQAIRYDRQRLAGLIRTSLFTNPQGIIVRQRASVEKCARSLPRAVRVSLAARHHLLEQLARKIEPLRPGSGQARALARIERLETLLHSAVRGRLRCIDLSHPQRALSRALVTRLDKSRSAMEALARELHAVSPQRVLERGYSVTLAADGSAVRSVATLKQGDIIRTRLADGSVASVIGSEAAVAVPPLPPISPPPPRRSRRKPDEGGPSLFGE